MKHFGIFIEPTGSLAVSIRAAKAEVERLLPGQKFCSHPPHSTLIYGKYQEPKLWRDQLTTALAALSPFRIQTTEFGFFYDDALAGADTPSSSKRNPCPQSSRCKRPVAMC